MTPEVQQAITEIQQAFSSYPIHIQPEAQGGAYVVIEGVPIGEQYAPSTSWVGFSIGFHYPHADVYPHFIDGNVKRIDGRGWGSGLHGPMNWNDRTATQISRRSNRLNPAIDTAASKLLKVLTWLRSQ